MTIPLCEKPRESAHFEKAPRQRGRCVGDFRGEGLWDRPGPAHRGSVSGVSAGTDIATTVIASSATELVHEPDLPRPALHAEPPASRLVAAPLLDRRLDQPGRLRPGRYQIPFGSRYILQGRPPAPEHGSHIMSWSEHSSRDLGCRTCSLTSASSAHSRPAPGRCRSAASRTLLDPLLRSGRACSDARRFPRAIATLDGGTAHTFGQPPTSDARFARPSTAGAASRHQRLPARTPSELIAVRIRAHPHRDLCLTHRNASSPRKASRSRSIKAAVATEAFPVSV